MEYLIFMLNYTVIKEFFKKNPEGYINIVQVDKVFKLSSDIPYSLDTSSITLLGIYYTDKVCGNSYARKGNFIIPFNQIVRIEYIIDYIER